LFIRVERVKINIKAPCKIKLSAQKLQDLSAIENSLPLAGL